MPEETRADGPPFPRLGAGVGLRTKHYAAALAAGAPLPDFFEVVTENFLGAGGRPREVLVEAANRRPIALHGVSLSIGSTDPLDARYLDRVAALVELVKPAIVSDHLCWTSHGGRHSHDLLPLRFTEHEADRIASRVAEVQARLGMRILLENVSSYLAWRGSTMTEWAFLAAVAERADAGILLDVNNVFVSARNHGFDAREYLRGMPAGRVGQIHLAGHQDRGTYLFDTHDAPVADPVWALYEETLALHGPVATLIERDDKIPPYEELLAEAARARAVLSRVASAPAMPPIAPRDPRRGESKRPEPRDATAAGHALLFAALSGASTGVLAEIDAGGLAPATRVEVYASSYRARLHDALLEDFPATDAFLGHDRFHATALEYARAHPSTSPDLGDFGASFAAFLRSRDAVAADLAALEWARTEAFDAADGTPLTMRALAAIAPGRWPALRFTPHPSLRFVSVQSRVDTIWKAADAGEPLPLSPGLASGVIRVWREGTTVFHAWMEAPEAAALSALARGEPFESAAGILAASLNATPEDAASALAAHLRDWIGDGLFVAAN